MASAWKDAGHGAKGQDIVCAAVSALTCSLANALENLTDNPVQVETESGLRWIDYSSGVHNRVEVAARRAVMTGFRQIQGWINEQTAKELGTDSY